MGKLYTLDEKLICGVPEIRIGDKVFAVDDRKNTVEKAHKLFNKDNDSEDSLSRIDELFKLAFGKRHKEIEAMELSFKASNELVNLVLAAMMGEDEENLKEKKEESFPDREMV